MGVSSVGFEKTDRKSYIRHPSKQYIRNKKIITNWTFSVILKTDKSLKNIHSDSVGILHAKIAYKKVNIISVICIKKRVRYATTQSKQNRKKD